MELTKDSQRTTGRDGHSRPTGGNGPGRRRALLPLKLRLSGPDPPSERGRLAWVEEECGVGGHGAPARRGREPEAYKRVKGSRGPRRQGPLLELSVAEGRREQRTSRPFKCRLRGARPWRSECPRKTTRYLGEIKGLRPAAARPGPAAGRGARPGRSRGELPRWRGRGGRWYESGPPPHRLSRPGGAARPRACLDVSVILPSACWRRWRSRAPEPRRLEAGRACALADRRHGAGMLDALRPPEPSAGGIIRRTLRGRCGLTESAVPILASSSGGDGHVYRALDPILDARRPETVAPGCLERGNGRLPPRGGPGAAPSTQHSDISSWGRWGTCSSPWILDGKTEPVMTGPEGAPLERSSNHDRSAGAGLRPKGGVGHRE